MSEIKIVSQFKFLFDIHEIKNITNNINFLSNCFDKTIFRIEWFESFHEIILNPTIDHLKPLIDELLSIQFNIHLKDNIDRIGFCLFITTQIEKMITTIHKIKSSTQLPRTLSEILQKMYEEHIVPYGLILLCILIIGPPTGLNLRNLLWHGFMNDNEVTDTHLCLLVILYQTIQMYCFKISEPKHLNILQIQFFDQIIEIPNEEFLSLIHSSNFILPNRKQPIEMIIKNKTQQGNNIIFSFMRMVVELEHLLRIAFITLNDVDIRFGMANYSNYYTTMDVLLQEFVVSSSEGLIVNRPSTINDIKVVKYKNTSKYSEIKGIKKEKEIISKKRNLLINILGKDIVSKLHDLFLYEGGIKLRDCLSHGEYQVDDLPSQSFLIIKMIWFIILKRLQDWTVNSSSQFNQNFQKYFNEYPMFHPLSFFKRNYQESINYYESIWNYFKLFNYEDKLYDDYRNYHSNFILSFNCLDDIKLINNLLASKQLIYPFFGSPLFLSNVCSLHS
ncbi:hypothetical protein EDI_272850 [Entamoeba dispar SAW760]|uniref:DUF4209 domain-containing protein n=1 Tax=Entamoeba dispar (strain ATCC PRA-260 / SAW760) TaxID=370354 RepID=B0EU33_ENTDS|nr:uncharacterized protein EDI_272850 [Entamoeba dispar SAW760]EDR21950.1 hypothetical protein EDI_272850 [Entamoeba dispar SAW760]|eukprot:EDR21950.1 hypothetical protein EDI_272850 [Entamoeba dispar SAW760]